MSMRLQKHLSRKYGEKTYFKHVIVIPSDLIEKLDWKDEQEIKGSIKSGNAIIAWEQK